VCCDPKKNKQTQKIKKYIFLLNYLSDSTPTRMSNSYAEDLDYDDSPVDGLAQRVDGMAVSDVSGVTSDVLISK